MPSQRMLPLVIYCVGGDLCLLEYTNTTED